MAAPRLWYGGLVWDILTQHISRTGNGGAVISKQELARYVQAREPSIRREPWGLFADIDGTLADITSDPSATVVRPGCIRALDDLSRRLAVVGVLTGRELAVARRLVGLDSVVYFGTHGMERWEAGVTTISPEAERYVERVHPTAQALRSQLAAAPGVYLEEKAFGISVHYRNAPDPEAAERRIRRALDDMGVSEWMDVRTGKMLLDLRLPVQVSKGTALRTLAEERRLRGAIAIGDDLTDVDMFHASSALSRKWGISAVNVAVVGNETPAAVVEAANHRLAGVDEVEGFLLWLSGWIGEGSP